MRISRSSVVDVGRGVRLMNFACGLDFGRPEGPFLHGAPRDCFRWSSISLLCHSVRSIPYMSTMLILLAFMVQFVMHVSKFVAALRPSPTQLALRHTMFIAHYECES